MKVEPEDSGTFRVVDGDQIVASGLTNAKAWRIADIGNNEHLSKAESTSDWLAKQMAVGTVWSPAPLRLTEAEIDAARTAKGGWTAKQLAAWGVSWPPPKGWRKALLQGKRP